jgi:transcriptional regulator with XRE-family HTH domain
MDITKLLRDRRLELNISQRALANYCGFRNKASISYLETDKREWQMRDVIKACELLKLQLVITKE